MIYSIESIDKLLPLELVFPTHLNNLEKSIDSDGYILKAIIADKNTGTILDGSHRYAYFLKKGYITVPVFWVDYNDEHIHVGTHLRHRFLVEGKINISKNECIQRALSGNLYQPRTTRHFFPFRKTDITLPLSQLKLGNPRPINHLIANVDVSDEIAHNEKYLDEIQEEVDIIIKYLSEVSQTKEYLSQQVCLMKESMKVAFFPGKFHPPHIGHILTMLNILPKYKKLIIGVSEDIPNDNVTTPNDIRETLGLFFKNFKNVELSMIHGVLIHKKSLEGLPKFDVLLSGNPDVLNWAEHHGIEAKFVPRSEGVFCSGTEIRKILSESYE
jgi:nicotinamide mononucleotide adenylyltransferase